VERFLQDGYGTYRSISDTIWARKRPHWHLLEIEESIALDDVDFRVKGHLKHEVLTKHPTKARLIQAHWNERTAYEFAGEYKAFHLALADCSGLDVVVGRTQAKVWFAMGMSPTEIANVVGPWENLGWLYESDGTNWDANIQSEHLRIKLDVYAGLDPLLYAHAKRWVGRFTGKVLFKDHSFVAYAGSDTVKSGAPDTSSGNSLMRAELFVRAVSSLGLPWVHVIVMGDDLLACLPHGCSVQEILRAERAFGVAAKGAGFAHLEQVTFISCTFPALDGGVCMVPLPGRMFAKLGWTIHPIGLRSRGGYVRAVFRPYQAIFRGFQFFERWIAWHMRVPFVRGLPASQAPKPPMCTDVGGSPDWAKLWSLRYCGVLPTWKYDHLEPSLAWIVNDPEIIKAIRVDSVDPEDRLGQAAQ